MPKVNPEILVWARETAGLTQEEAAKKLGFRDSGLSSAKDKLQAIEYGQKEPSRPQLLKMAGQYRRPLLAFYLSKPPQQSKRGVDFRTLPQGDFPYKPYNEGLLDALVRDIRARQSMVRAVLEEEDEAETLSFIGSHQIEDGQESVLGSLKALIGVDVEAYRAQSNTSAAFDMLRGRIERAGVFVLLKGDLGNYLSAIETTVFRGFSIADVAAPFIVINDQDARAAWTFTLLHETVHLLLGHTGVSGENGESEVERFCDDVAGGYLLPEDVLHSLALEDRSNFSEISKQISALANEFKISHTMVAYKAFRSSLINQESYAKLSAFFRREWLENRARIRATAQEQEAGPNYYTVRRHRLGGRIVNLAQRMMAAEAITTSKAARILGVSPRQVNPLLGAVRSS